MAAPPTAGQAAVRVAIIGAGIAGLAAARILVRSGWQVIVIEARRRVGGRIFTRHVSEAGDTAGAAIEMGAEFIHGLPPETWALLREGGLQTYEVHGTHLCFVRGVLQNHNEPREGGFALIEQMVQWLDAQPTDCDMPFADYLALTAANSVARARAVEYVEGFNAADSGVIGIAALARQQRAEDAIDSDRLFRVNGGYDALPRYLANEIRSAGGAIVLGNIAQRVSWQRGAVTILGVRDSGEAFEVQADRALISIPLGVLQAGSVEISPSPAAILAHAARLRMGPVLRMTLVFSRRFWGEATSPIALPGLESGLGQLSFLFTHGTLPSTWWTPMPDTAPMITAWIAGPNVNLIHPAGSTLEKLLPRVLHTLATALGVAPNELKALLRSWHTHDWQADPFAQGAYSYAAAGAVDASAHMAQPVEETLYFAGEHTDTTGHWGTVHGALRSGIRAATQLLASG